MDLKGHHFPRFEPFSHFSGQIHLNFQGMIIDQFQNMRRLCGHKTANLGEEFHHRSIIRRPYGRKRNVEFFLAQTGFSDLDIGLSGAHLRLGDLHIEIGFFIAGFLKGGRSFEPFLTRKNILFQSLFGLGNGYFGPGGGKFSLGLSHFTFQPRCIKNGQNTAFLDLIPDPDPQFFHKPRHLCRDFAAAKVFDAANDGLTVLSKKRGRKEDNRRQYSNKRP